MHPLCTLPAAFICKHWSTTTIFLGSAVLQILKCYSEVWDITYFYAVPMPPVATICFTMCNSSKGSCNFLLTQHTPQHKKRKREKKLSTLKVKHFILFPTARHTGMYCDCILQRLEFETICQTAKRSSATTAFCISHVWSQGSQNT
jgi:hypothetical protein